MRLIRTASGVLVLSLTMASCSSGGKSATSTSLPSGASSSIPTTSTTTQPSQNVAADKALSHAASLKLSDFPTGWTSQPNNPNPNVPNVDQSLASCLHTSASLFNRNSPTQVQSPDFSDSNGDTVNSQVTYSASASIAEPGLALLQSPRMPSCLQTAVSTLISYALAHPSNPSDSVPSGVSVGQTTVDQMSFPTLGDQTIAYRVTVPVSAASLNIDAYVDGVWIRKGRAVALLEFEGIGNPLDPTMEQQLATLTVGRFTNT